MKLFITGARGLLGHAIVNAFHDWEIVAPASSEVDVADADAVERCMAAARPHLAIHSAAMTQVDACELEPAQAWRVNVLGTENVARSAARHGVRLVIVSTDYVFPGELGRPYTEDDAVGPRSAYGSSKAAAERAALHLCPDVVIARVSWLFGPGRPSFVDQLVAQGRAAGMEPVRVAADQYSVPTSTRSVAWALRDVAATGYRGVVHLVSQGSASRHELARAVFDHLELPRALAPCSMAELASPARRPRDSRLVSVRLPALGLPPMPGWRDELIEYLTATHGGPAAD